jgi:hypothetical protein
MDNIKREAQLHTSTTFRLPSPQALTSIPADDLRRLLQTAALENDKLKTEAMEARMSSAHHKLQYNLLAIETEEAVKRMEVEHEMTRREVEVLRMATAAHRDSTPTDYKSELSANTELVKVLKDYCRELKQENKVLKERLDTAKEIIAERDEEIDDITKQNTGLLQRIRTNREHMNEFIKATTPQIGYPATPGNFPVTPQQMGRSNTQATPRSARQAHPLERHHQDSFATLLLADRVLNDRDSAPSTPISAIPPSHRAQQHRHNRNVQSLSSLPSTPLRTTQQGHLLPAAQFVPQSEPRYRTTQEYYSHTANAHHQHSSHGLSSNLRTPLPTSSAAPQPQPQRHRRKSRDSTISASDNEQLATYAAAPAPATYLMTAPRRGGNVPTLHHGDSTESQEGEGDDGVPGSQASEAATRMLRRDPRESFEVRGEVVDEYAGSSRGRYVGSPKTTAKVAEKGKLLQSKIFGGVAVSKPGMGSEIGGEKRKRVVSAEMQEEESTKKLRAIAREGVGLGLFHN